MAWYWDTPEIANKKETKLSIKIINIYSMIPAIIITSLIFLSLLVLSLFFTCYSALWNRTEYLKIIDLYNHIFKNKNSLKIIENSQYKDEVYKKFSYKEYDVIYWGIGDDWSMHSGNNYVIDCVISRFSKRFRSGIVTNYMYRKINKYLKERD